MARSGAAAMNSSRVTSPSSFASALAKRSAARSFASAMSMGKRSPRFCASAVTAAAVMVTATVTATKR